MITGIVSKTSTKDVTTKFGVKKTFSINVDGAWYSCGFKDPKVNEGDNVSFEFTESTYGKQIEMGTFKKAAGASIASSGPKPSSTGGGYSRGVFPIPPLDGQRSIVRQNALTNAREAVMQITVATTTSKGEWGKVEDDELAMRIIHMARIFESYACGDLDLADAKAEMEEEG